MPGKAKKSIKGTNDVKKPKKKGGKKDPKNAPKNSKKDPKTKNNTKNNNKGKGNGKGKGGNKKNNKKKAASNEDEKTNDSSSLQVDIGPPVILPESKEFYTEIAPITKIELKDDDNVAQIKSQFEAFEKLLKQRKKDCLVHARTLIVSDTDDTPPVCIDINGMKRLIKNIGTKGGELDYNRRVTRTRCLEKIKELMAYEAKHASVTKQRERTSAELIEKEIAEGQKVLDEAEPVLQRARDALTKITKSSLDEIRALPKPHKLLVRTIQACALMVGKKESELDGWPNVKKLLKTTFINSLIEFEARNITKKTRGILETQYLGIDNDDIPENEKLTFENVNKANSVAGNLVSWIEAQLKYNEFIPKVEPMQKKLEELKVQLASVEGIVNKYDTALTELNTRIVTAKQEMRDNGKAFESAANACK